MSDKNIWVLIGPSGSGKSTISEKIKQLIPNVKHYSLDDLRMKWFDSSNYRNAWNLANKDPNFFNKANDEYKELLKLGTDIILDNTNLSPRIRKFYISEAKRKGYSTIAVVFNVDLDTLKQRQVDRGDKAVPDEVVTHQYNNMTTPLQGEFDKVIQSTDPIFQGDN